MNLMRVAADRIAVSFGIEPLDVRITPRGGPEVAQLQLREGLAAFLERIAEVAEGRRQAIDQVADIPIRESGSRAKKGMAGAMTKGETDGSDRHDEALPQLAGAQ
jgi:hypothetical protein